MEDCKRERRLSDPLDPPSEETMKWACDVLGHHLKTMRELNRKSKLPIEVTEEHIKIINSFMEEKKTKKMTKLEAFEYFKRKKIHAEGEDANIGVQKKLFQCGVKWVNGGSVPFYHSDYLIVDESGRLYHCGCDDRYWFAHYYESLDADDILSIEILEDKNNEFVDCSEPCPEIKAVQELLRNSNSLKDKIVVITKDNAAVL